MQSRASSTNPTVRYKERGREEQPNFGKVELKERKRRGEMSEIRQKGRESESDVVWVRAIEATRREGSKSIWSDTSERKRQRNTQEAVCRLCVYAGVCVYL